MQFSNEFLKSQIAVEQSAVKSILFRVASILLQFVFVKIFSYAAFQGNSFTSWLLFSEDLVQRGLFIVSRGFSRATFLVLGFTIVLTVANFFDTLLWAVDAPGYIFRSSVVRASEYAKDLLPNPNYIISLSGPVGAVDGLDPATMIGANLFQPLNLTLTGEFDREIAVPSTASANLKSKPEGPRLWLDDDGLSIGIDRTKWTMSIVGSGYFCPSNISSANQQIWRCNYNNTYASDMFLSLLGRPEIWWNSGDSEVQSLFLTPAREDNSWAILGTGGGTAFMKQMFTLTKQRIRYSFMHSTFKTTLLSTTGLGNSEITDFVRRTWSSDPEVQLTDPYIEKFSNIIIAAQDNGEGVTMGTYLVNGTTVVSAAWQLYNVLNGFDQSYVYTALQISLVNITLLRTDIIEKPLLPFEACDVAFMNLAIAGKVRSTNCAQDHINGAGKIDPGEGFLGQVDVSSVVIMSDLLGDGSKNTSAQALNQTALDWYRKNGDTLDNLVISRGLILSVDPGLVSVRVNHLVPAISYLQILLVAIPTFFALLLWILASRCIKGHYQATLLATIIATTHTTSTGNDRCHNPGYMRHLPEILLRDSRDGHVMIGTKDGTFMHQGDLVDPDTPALDNGIAIHPSGGRSPVTPPEKRELAGTPTT